MIVYSQIVLQLGAKHADCSCRWQPQSAQHPHIYPLHPHFFSFSYFEIVTPLLSQTVATTDIFGLEIFH